MGSVLQITVALGFLAWAFGWTPRAFAQALAADKQPHRIWRDAVPLILAATVILWGEAAVGVLVAEEWLPSQYASVRVPPVNYAVPWLGQLLWALERGFNRAFGLALIASLLVMAWRRYPRRTIAALILYPLLGAIAAPSWTEFAYTVFIGEFALLIQALLILVVVRFNPVVLFGSYFLSSLISSASVLWHKGGPTYSLDGMILAGIAVSILAWMLFAGRRATPAVPH
jgi:hypothetical protein